jgi:hypothetical protein
MTESPVSEIAPGIFRVADTCNVYVVRAHAGPDVDATCGRTAVATDLGSGLALDDLREMASTGSRTS